MRLLFRDHRRHEGDGSPAAFSRLRQFKGSSTKPLPILQSRCPLGLSRICVLACLRKLLIEFTVADRRDQGVDHGRQFVERRNGNCGLAFFELDWLQPAPNKQGIAAVRMLSPPQRHALLLFDHDPFPVLLHPLSICSGVVRVFQDQLLLLEPRNNFGAAIKDRVAAL